MPNLTRSVTTALKYATLTATLGFVVVIAFQIFARLLLPTAPSWTEEAARLCFVLAIGSAAGLGLRSGEYVNFDFVYQQLPVAWRRGVDWVIDGATVLLFALFTWYAVEFTVMGWAESSPSLRFPMAVPFAATVLLGASVLFYAVGQLRRRFTTKNDDR